MKRFLTTIRTSSGQCLSGILLSAVVCFLLFLYAPLETYISNIHDFSYDIYDVIRMMLPLTVVFFAFFTALLMLLRRISEGAYRFCLTFGFALFMGIYIQGTFLSGRIPVLDGSLISWEAYGKERLCSAALFCTAILAGVLLLRFLPDRKREKLIAAVCGGLFLMLLLSIVLLGLNSEAGKRKIKIITSGEEMFSLSDDTNFLILLVDNLEGKMLEEALDNHPQDREALEDFTFFRNTVGAYPFTFHAIPQLLTGELFLNDENFYDYVERAFRQSPLFSELEAQGYRIGVYEAEMTPASENSVTRFENVYLAGEKFTFPWNFIKMQLSFSFLKYFPYQLKPFFILTPQNITDDSLIEAVSPCEDIFSARNTYLYEKLTKEPITKSEKNCFRFIHIVGAHAPFDLDIDLNPIDPERGSYTDGVECSMTLIKAFLNKLRENGVFDRSVIIIMSDHGYINRQNPALLIKGTGEKHGLTISDIPVSYRDLQEIYHALLEQKTSPDLFSWKEDETRERIFIQYELGDDEHMEEMIQTGHAYSMDTLLPTGQVYVAP